jgi:hypothetical protein
VGAGVAKKKLTNQQWQDIEKRLLSGEKLRPISREYEIAESTIRTRLSGKTAQIKDIANQVITAEQAFNSLPISAQISAQSLINDLRAISTHLAGAAKFGSITAHRLAGIANMQLDKIDETELTNPESESIQTLKSVAILTDISNKSAQTGINLLNANKDALQNASSADNLQPLTFEEFRRLQHGPD